MTIVAIDLGKGNSVACVYEAVSDRHEFVRFRTTPTELGKLMKQTRPDRVVIEICPAAGWVADLVRSMEIPLQVIHGNHDGWRWRNVKRKTDRDDALKMARLSAMNQVREVYVPSRSVRQWRSLIQARQSVVKRLRRTKNRIRSILEREAIPWPAGQAGWTRGRQLALHELARPLEDVSMDEFWRGELHVELSLFEQAMSALKTVEAKLDQLAVQDSRVQLLETIPGMGRRTAEMIVAVIDDPSRFKSGKQVGSYLGLTPRQYQSGFSNRQGRISGEGHKILRALLVEVSWLARRWNPRLKSVYERVRRGSPARKKIAIVATARRLLIWCWAMLRDGRPWDEQCPALESSSFAEPVRREPLPLTHSAVAHSLRSNRASDGRAGPEPQGQAADPWASPEKRRATIATFFKR
jgi:transposase